MPTTMDGPPYQCLQAGCTGHTGPRQICLDPVRFGTPYDIELRQVQQWQAQEMSDLRIRHTEQLIALARRFDEVDDFGTWMSRLRELRRRREQINVVHV